MNPIIFKTVNGKKVYLSTTGRWVKSKIAAQVFGTVEAARVAADAHCATVTFYTFRD